MKWKKGLALLTAAALSLGAFGGAVPSQGMAVVAAKENKADKTYGKPWINSNVTGMVTKSVNASVHDDYYLAKNHNRFIQTKLDPGRVEAGTLSDISDQVDARLQALMTDPSQTADYAKQVQEYYQMFLDWDSRNAASREHFEAHLKPIQDITDLESLTAYLGSDESVYYGKSVFNWGTTPDSSEPDVYTVAIVSTPLSLGDAAEYENETSYGARQRKAVTEKAEYVLRYAGYTDEEAAQIIADAFAFEKDIAASEMTQEDAYASDATERMNNPRTGEELAAQSVSFPLMDILTAVGYGASARYNLWEPAWLARLNELYTPERVGQIKDYLLFRYAIDSITFLDEAAYREAQRINREFYGLEASRSDAYYAYTNTQSALYNYVDQMYVAKYCSPKMKRDVKRLMEEIVAEYKKMLRSETWLSAATRRNAIRKLNAISLNAVYPDKWADWSALSFATRAEGGSYQDASDAVTRMLIDRDKSRINGRVDRAIWDTSCTEVNASYWPDRNRILVYAGILNGAIYHASMTEEQKLGSIGVFIGHEISHAFDNNGAQYDEKGRIRNWWTKADARAFQKRADKLVAYYNKILPFKNRQHYKGTLVQGEAIADLGGMRCVLSLASKKKDFDYKKFFSAYARVWFSEMTEESMENIYMQNEHPIDYLRVNVVVSQFEEFYKAYGIKKGDKMYLDPKDRIAVW